MRERTTILVVAIHGAHLVVERPMCSGRFLARFSVTTFVATLLHRFDIELVGNSEFPHADEGRPVWGTMSVKEGDNFKVNLTPKASFE